MVALLGGGVLGDGDTFVVAFHVYLSGKGGGGLGTGGAWACWMPERGGALIKRRRDGVPGSRRLE